MLKLHPVRYDWDLLKRALRPGVSWASKQVEMSRVEEVVLRKIADSQHADALEMHEYLLGQVQAAGMICQANSLLAAYARSEKSSPAGKRRFVDAVAQRPLCFCASFWMVLGADGERKVFSRGRMRTIEDSLSHGVPGAAPEYEVAQLFSFLMSYSDVAANDSDIKPIADEMLHRLIHERLVPHFSMLSTVPPNERQTALKNLRSLLIAAFDAACQNNDFDLHRRKNAVEWPVTSEQAAASEQAIMSEQPKKVLPAWAAIQHAKGWLAEHAELPTKGELAKRMSAAHPELRGLTKSSWSAIWADAGLSDLPGLKPWQGSAKELDFREPDLKNIVRQPKK